MFWTSHRYGRRVLDSMSEALDGALATAGARTLILVGYSGGGTVAALLAARRSDVRGLITVAANLDHAAWTSHHGDTPLDGSLNPADFADALRAVPQAHFAGEDDDVVPLAVVRSFTRRLQDATSSRLVVVPGADHRCCWLEAWPTLIREARSRLAGKGAAAPGSKAGHRS